jgi:hypothetical protein
MEASKIEKYSLHDGRRAERRVFETKDSNDGAAEIVTEIYVEEERPLRLSERVLEKKKPFVYERVIETVDQDGNIVEQKTESTDPGSRMHVVDHIGVMQHDIHAQSYSEDDCDCNVTKEEMIEAIVAGVRAARMSDDHHYVAPPVHKNVAPVEERPSGGEIRSLGLADTIAKRQGDSGTTEYSTTDKVLMGVIAAMVIGLVYVIFMM